MQEFIATGKTVEEAVDNACAQIGLTRDDVSVEVLELPQKKLFGMSDAKVKVTPLDINFSIAEILEQKVAAETAKKEEPRPVREKRPRKDSAPKAEPPAREARPENEVEAEPFVEMEEALEEIAEELLTAPAAAALAYFRELSAGMGATNLTYSFFKTERGVKFVIEGEDASLVIGRRGETMDALQYLCMLVSSRTPGDYCKIMLDVAGYRKKREKTLQDLARREAEKVKRTLYNQTLEPMNPYERRIVHSTIQNIPEVKSESVGSEPHRRVVISLISGGKGNRRRGGSGSEGRGGSRSGNNNRGRGGNSRGGNNRGPRRYDDRAQQSAPAPGEAPVREKTETPDGAMLYGKIDL